MNKTKPTLAEFRRKLKLDEFQKELLEQTWQTFRASGTWPTLRELYSQHGKKKVKKALTAPILSEASTRDFLADMRLLMLSV